LKRFDTEQIKAGDPDGSESESKEKQINDELVQ